jgi:hypothetical protein
LPVLQGPRQGQERHHHERGNPAQAQRNPQEAPRDDSDFQLRIAVHPTVLERLRTEDEKLIIEMEKRYFGKLSFRAEPASTPNNSRSSTWPPTRNWPTSALEEILKT